MHEIEPLEHVLFFNVVIELDAVSQLGQTQSLT